MLLRVVFCPKDGKISGDVYGVPALIVEDSEFRSCNAFVSFVDRFLELNRESCFQIFKLRYDSSENGYNMVQFKRWINNSVVNRKVKHFDFSDYTDLVEIPQNVYTCGSLVSLKLFNVVLPDPNFVSLPFVKVIKLSIVKVANVLVLEKLISSCPVLERLSISRSSVDGIDVLRVCSRSLVRFKHVGDYSEGWDKLEVVIDAPRLKYLRLDDHKTARFRIQNSGSPVEADIDIIFNIEKLLGPDDLPKRNMIRDFLVGISNVKKMFISWSTLKVIYDYSKCELPIFRNLSSLHVYFEDHGLEMLSTFLERCPNLKSLVVEFKDSQEKEGFRVLSVPRCFLTSLEYVHIERPITGETRGMNLISYILENSAILKKLTLSLEVSINKEESVIFKKLLTIPRLSTSCQIIVL